ncbi:MAG: response regulator [Oscillospiraceae bacterium]|nr:response regulator [Oscillospiraceae bacterium]
MNDAKKYGVLVVDDENTNILALSHILSPKYDVYAAKNGQGAIKAAEKYLPDLILLDIIMPEMDGYAVLSALRENERTKNIPVIFITGLSGASDEEKALSMGAADCISKPFSPAVVKLRVENQLTMLGKLRAIEYDVMNYKLASEAMKTALWDMEVVVDDPVNLDNRFTWSQEFRHMLGFSDETEFPNVLRSWYDRLHPDDKDRSVVEFEAHLNDRTGKTPYELEYRLKNKNGEYRYYDGFGQTLRDSEGAPIRVSGYIRDVTERKLAEDLLVNSDLRLNLLLKSLNVAMWDMWVNPASPVMGENELWWSQELRHMLGFKDENDFPNLLSSWSDRLHPEDKEETLEAFAAHLNDYSGNTHYNREFRLMLKNGEYRQFHAFGESLRDPGGVPIRVAGALRDVTQQKLMEDALQEANFVARNARTQEFISRFSMPFTRPYDFDELIGNALSELRGFTGTDRAIILELQPDGSLRCTYESVINEQTPKVLGLSLAYEVANPLLDQAEKTGCFYEKNAARYFEEYPAMDLGEKSFCYIPLMVEGERAGYLVFFTMFEQANWTEGEFRLATMAGSIIAGAFSNRKNSILKEEALKAHQASEAKSNFLSVMSHEMRTPLNAIIGMTAIGKDAQDAARRDYALGRIEEASTSLLGIINDVLDMAKIEANKLELSPIEYNIEWMLQKVLSVVKFRMDEKQQKFEMDLDAKIPHFIVGDDQRLSQVVTNLLTNASKFTPEGGEIHLSISLESEDGDTCRLRFEVTDNGIGISPEQQERLFRAFLQAESGTSRTFGGTGLGLALSKRIVELMDGQIWLESALGKGSRFIFTVNAQRGKQQLISLLNPGVLHGSLGILVVDDDPVTRDYFKYVFGYIGIPCDMAENGTEALEMIEARGGYDLYFVDWYMEGMDGYELCGRIKSYKHDREPVVVVISGDWQVSEAKAFEAGADKGMMKPFFASSIIECVNSCLAEKGSRTEEDFIKQTREQYRGKRLLLAEDVEINREIVISLLEGTGLAIDEAENGSEALGMIKADPRRYDLVLMDIQMPGMDGLEATRRIRGLEDTRAKRLPIIAMTANVFKEDIEKCLEAGMDGHIGKPLNIDELMQVLKDYLTRPSAGSRF